MSNKIYTTIPAPKVPRNTFNRSRPNTLTMPFQRNVVSMVEEIYPGDLMRCNPELFARLQPMIAPVMNNMKISTHFFYVPLRTLNKHFSEFMFNNRTGDYSEVLPYIYTGTIYYLVYALHDGSNDFLAAEVIRLADYIGLPFRYSSKTSASLFVSSWLSDDWNNRVAGYDPDAAEPSELVVDSGIRINLAPYLAYQKIWSEYFRDENVEEDPFVDFENYCSQDVFDWTGDVSDIIGTLIDAGKSSYVALLFQLRRRAWAHDRFTSSLPFAQRGPDVLLPISGTAPVLYKEGFLKDGGQAGFVGLVGVPGKEEAGAAASSGPSSGNNIVYRIAGTGGSLAQGSNLAYDPGGSLETDFSSADLSTTINDFRIAERVQRWFENDARGGVRPNEGTLAHFGIRTPDASLDRAEFIGGSMQPIVVSEVAQTSESTETSPQGTLAGKGTSYNSNRGFRMFFTEHGFVFGICSALVRANYWQGIPKVFSRMQRDEYYWPEFANLGEEPVFTKELYADAVTVSEDDVFGYVPRYSDLKSAVGEVHGDMRSSLSFWTQTREFSNKPVLNREFLFADPSLSPFAVQSLYSDPIIVTIQMHLKASRLMPFYGVPTL